MEKIASVKGFNITTLHAIRDDDDLDAQIREIWSNIDEIISTRSESRESKNKVKEAVEHWYSVCLPYVGGGLNVVKVLPKRVLSLTAHRVMYRTRLE